MKELADTIEKIFLAIRKASQGKELPSHNVKATQREVISLPLSVAAINSGKQIDEFIEFLIHPINLARWVSYLSPNDQQGDLETVYTANGNCIMRISYREADYYSGPCYLIELFAALQE